jgi:glycosyltransferase involved in cell wall biosynthesis
MSRVDVVIPCYNYGRFLSDCVAGALDDQPGTDVRVLIIDDASTDDSAEIAQKLAASDDRIEVRVHEANRGHIATFNEGLLDWADGEYCVLISADDRLTPGALRRAAELMDAHPEVGLVYGNVVEFRGDEPPRPARTQVRGQAIWPGHWWLEQRFREARACTFSPEVVVRTSVQHQVGGYNPDLYHTSDAEMWMRLAAYSDVAFIRADQAFYRRHDQNMSLELGSRLVSLRQMRAAFEGALRRCGDVLPNAAELCAAVHKRLAKEALWTATRAYDRGRTDAVPVDGLVAFAFDCWPGAARLGVYRSLQLRQRIGPSVMPYFQPLIWSAVVRHAKDRWRWHRKLRRGI